MSDSTPKPAKGGDPKQQKQVKMLAVLGAVLVLVLVFMVVKPFSGGGEDVAPVAPTPTVAPVAGAPVAGAPVAGAPIAGAETVAPAPPPARPSRTPFDPPR